MFVRQPLNSFQNWQSRVCHCITSQSVYSGIFVAEYLQHARIIILAIAKHLKNFDSHVRKAAIEGVSTLAVRSMYCIAFQWCMLKHVCS